MKNISTIYAIKFIQFIKTMHKIWIPSINNTTPRYINNKYKINTFSQKYMK
jgi:hypothetical protein